MNRRIFILLTVLALVAFSQFGCDTRARLATQMEALKGELAGIEAQGAKVCAPREYAAAEAHLDFAHEEWSERDYIESQDHLVIVREQIAAARVWLNNCRETEPPDADGDGILDNVDQCPTEPEDIDGFEDENGCPDPDNDQDGILDANDLCPNEAETMNDFEDEDGCPDEAQEETDNIKVTDDAIILKKMINFRTGRSDLLPESFPILEDIAMVMKKHPTWKVRVEGHTDSRGNHGRNMTLSQARADSVRNYLINRGVDPARLTTAGYGPDHPIASNNTREGRAKNRRTEFKIISK